MKIGFSLLGLSAASHFRAGSLQYRTSATPGKMEVTRTMGWFRGYSGYFTPYCNQDHIDNRTPATVGSEYITGIGSVPATYIVSNIEDSPLVDLKSHFCFGSYTFEIDVSGLSSFDHTFSGCCTITLTDDNGNTFGGSYGYKALVRDVNNSSPQFTSPPIWYIMNGCGGQTYHVNPIDPEADTVRCRWSTSSESAAMAWTTNLQQFSLDEENCIVTYHPERDLTGRGSKPVAVQVEDFDSAGNLLHSVPLGFVGVVFTPQIDASRGFQKENPLYSGLLEGTDDHDDLDHDHDGRRRRSTDQFSHALLNPEEITTISRNVRSTEPDHCSGRPIFYGKSPVQGSEQVEVYEPGLMIEIDWEASYSIGGVTFYDIPRYQFSRPSGMTCTPFNSSGKAVCTWFPTVAQAAQGEHPHCAIVYDRYGRASDRQCVTLRVYPPCAEGEEREGSVCVCKPMSYENAMSTIREWIDMTTEVLEEAEHGRAYKFDVRMHKLLRNALGSYDANCTTPYDFDRIGKNEFAIWEKQATRSSDVCVQATTVKAGLNAWVDNYACMDKKNKKQTHRVSKFIGKVTNPYC